MLSVSRIALRIAFAATFMLSLAPAVRPASAEAGWLFFDETDHSVSGHFATAYSRLGGLSRFGYPRTEVVSEDGRSVQYFQRAVMEHWPEHAGTRYEVQLRLLGYSAGQQEARRPEWLPVAPSQAPAGARYFRETQHTVSPPFLTAFDAGGGIDSYGYPISDAYDRLGVRVQFFQRARFEHHPGNPSAYRVQLGLLGDELIARQWATDDARLARVPRTAPIVAATRHDWGLGSIRVSGGEVSRHNARIAVERTNGYVLRPGARFSFDDVARSWDGREDPIYKESRGTSCEGGLVPMRGGGVCYVSTAIWRAWMVAGLRTVERVSHSGLLDDFGAGFDAANTLTIENDSPATLTLVVTFDAVGVSARVVSDRPPDRRATLRGPVMLAEGEYVIHRDVELADGRRVTTSFRSSYCW
jgi:hypothetical protein